MKRLLVLVVIGLFVLSVSAQESQLGRVEFPTSGSEKAQAHFLRGLAALHSFWYEEAIEAFQESTRVEPDFAMGYWGEAMAHNHPLWSEQDIAAARQVLARLKESPKLTERERAYLNAVKLLYGEGDSARVMPLTQRRWRKSIAPIPMISTRLRSIRCHFSA